MYLKKNNILKIKKKFFFFFFDDISLIDNLNIELSGQNNLLYLYFYSLEQIFLVKPDFNVIKKYKDGVSMEKYYIKKNICDLFIIYNCLKSLFLSSRKIKKNKTFVININKNSVKIHYSLNDSYIKLFKENILNIMNFINFNLKFRYKFRILNYIYLKLYGIC